MGVGRQFGEWTEPEREFLADWKAVFGRVHDDWHSEAWENGTCSLERWFSWLAGLRESPSRERLRRVMEKFRRDLGGGDWARLPSLTDFRWEWDWQARAYATSAGRPRVSRRVLGVEETSALLRELCPEAFGPGGE